MRKAGPRTLAVIEALHRGFLVLKVLVLLGFVAFALSGLHSIQPNEAAIVLRFGNPVGKTRAEQIHGAGLLLALPFPIDEVIRVPIRDIRELTIDDFKPQVRTFFPGDALLETLNPTDDGYCLTGDQYIVQLRATIKYQITDLLAYALHESDPQARIQSSVMAQIIRSIGEINVDEVLTRGKKLLASTILERAQQRLNDPPVGVTLISFELNEVVPPPAVKKAFDEVVSASIQRETMIRTGEKYRAEEIPQAQTLANTMIRKAQSYREDILSRARSEVTAFYSILEQYRKDPEVVCARIFRESMDEISGQVGGMYLLAPSGQGQPCPAVRLILPGSQTP